MSNTYKIIIAAIAVTVLGATSIFIIGQNHQEDKPITPQSSLSVSSVKSLMVSSSSQSQILSSSSIVTQTSVVSLVKAESQVAISNTTKCNLPESENLVKTEDGCFELLTYGAIYKNPSFDEKQNANLLFKNDQNLKLVNEITKNYYSKIKDKIISKNNKIAIFGSKKLSNNEFSLALAIIDPEYFIKNLTKQEGQYGDRYNATYSITQQQDGTWSYQFQQFVKDSNSKINNE